MKELEPGLSPMVDVFSLAQMRGHIEGRVRLAAMTRLAPLLAETDGDVAWQLSGWTDAEGRPAATVKVSGAIVVNCDRCGARLELPIRTESQFWFVHSEGELNQLPIEVDEGEPLLGSRRFVVADLIEDELILALPISPRHLHCGCAGEPRKEPDRRRPFAALARLRSRH